MALEINIKGEGQVDKVVVDNTATLTAIAESSWTFKNYTIGSDTVTINPYSFILTGTDEVLATFYVTIEDYLRGLVAFDVPDSALNSIRVFRSIARGADIEELSQRQKDLAYADLLMWASSNPSSYTGSKQSDGGWSQTEASRTLTVTDKRRFEDQARSIYKQYGDPRYSSNIKIINLW